MRRLGILAGVLACAALLLCACTDGAQKADKENKKTVETSGIKKGEGKQEEKDAEKEEEIGTKWEDISDEQYEGLLCGSLTKAQFSFILAYGPKDMEGSKVSMEDLSTLLFYFSMCGERAPFEEFKRTDDGKDHDAWADYSLGEMNRLVSVLTDYELKESDNEKYAFMKVQGQNLSINQATPAREYRADIVSARRTKKEMEVEYLVSYRQGNTGDGSSCAVSRRTARLLCGEDGRYRISQIKEKTVTAKEDWENQYKSALGYVREHVADFDPVSRYYRYGIREDAERKYCLYDLSGDGIPELVLSAEQEGLSYWLVFSCMEGTEGIVVQEISGEVIEGAASAGGSRVGISVPADKNGLYLEEGESLSPMVTVSRLSVQDGEIKKEPLAELDWQTPEYESFLSGCGQLEWHGIEEDVMSPSGAF